MSIRSAEITTKKFNFRLINTMSYYLVIVKNPFIKFSHYSDKCMDKLDMRITKLVCNDEDYDIDYNFTASDFINVTDSMCDDRHVCSYTMSDIHLNSTIYCDAYVQGELNEIVHGSSTLLFW